MLVAVLVANTVADGTGTTTVVPVLFGNYTSSTCGDRKPRVVHVDRDTCTRRRRVREREQYRGPTCAE